MRVLRFAVPLLLAFVAADTPPLKVRVHQLLAHPTKYDGWRVDVTGYYTAGMEDSQLWPSARVAQRARIFEESVYIDAGF
jgi:hypothetical protein